MSNYNGIKMVFEFLDVDKLADAIVGAYVLYISETGDLITPEGNGVNLIDYLPVSDTALTLGSMSLNHWCVALEITVKLKLMAKAGGHSDYVERKYQFFDEYVKDACVKWDDYASAARDKGFPVHSRDVFNALTLDMDIPES